MSAEAPTRYTSVTAILNALPKHLTWWAGNAVADCAFNQQDEWKHLETKEERYEYVRRAHQRIKSDAAEIGTDIHRYIEAHNLGKPPGRWPLPIAKKMRQFDHWFETSGLTVEAAETKVYNRTYGYAGTLDIIGRIPGRDGLGIIDIKSGNQVWEEAGLQQAAYAAAEFLVADPHHPGAKQVTPARGQRWYEWHGPPEDEVPMPWIAWAALLHLRHDGYELVFVKDLAASFRDFTNLIPTDQWLREGKKHVFGERVRGSAPVEEKVA